MFTYRLHLEDGSDAGEATYAQMIKPGEEIIAGKNEHFRVVDVVSFAEEDESPFSGCCRSRLPDASHAGCRESLPKLRTVRGSESPRDAFAAAADTNASGFSPGPLAILRSRA